MFLAPWFAVAGLAAAAGPILIHLLNRRRHRVVQWAAMDFLREAVLRNRRIMQLRDLLLLALRTVCLVLFGLAMARPFLGTSVVGIDRDRPIHAVLLLDNSLSMGYRESDHSLLDGAQAQAAELVEQLPRGSRISVLPICGPAVGDQTAVSYTAHYTRQDALQAVDQIQPVDRSALAGQAVDMAIEACDRVPEIAAKQIVLFTDRQVLDWAGEPLADRLKRLPGPVKVVQLTPGVVENAWVSDFQLRDGVADRRTPAVFAATVRYQGSLARRDAEVTLTVDGLAHAAQSITLQPGQSRRVEFPPYEFKDAQSDEEFYYAAAEVSVALRRDGATWTDGLPADDRRFMIVPVVEELPVVFVDQWGDRERPQLNRYGETYHLRRLLAPEAPAAGPGGRPVAARHVRIEQVDRGLLESARLVVIAGVAGPEPAVADLREYVRQGGNLLIAAGGRFDPAVWTAAGWLCGLGILPAPLRPVTVGGLPEESQGPLEPFQLDYQSLKSHDYFLLEGISQQQQQDLYRLPYFFKAVEADVSDETAERMIAAVAERLRRRQGDLAEIDGRLAELDELVSRRQPSPEESRQREDLLQRRSRLEPAWLRWRHPLQVDPGRQPVEELARRTRFSVLARYSNALPYMVQRRIGRGKVLMVTSGVYSGWNTLSLTNTVLVFDRILREMLRETLPKRNLDCQRPHLLPVAAARRNARITLTGPHDFEELLAVDAVGPARYAVTVDNVTRRGHYRVTVVRGGESSADGPPEKLREVPLAINGPAEESELVSAAEAELRGGRGGPDSAAAAGPFSLGGFQRAQLHGTDLWKWIMLAVLAGLLLELVFLAWPSRSRPPAGGGFDA